MKKSVNLLRWGKDTHSQANLQNCPSGNNIPQRLSSPVCKAYGLQSSVVLLISALLSGNRRSNSILLLTVLTFGKSPNVKQNHFCSSVIFKLCSPVLRTHHTTLVLLTTVTKSGVQVTQTLSMVDYHSMCKCKTLHSKQTLTSSNDHSIQAQKPKILIKCQWHSTIADFLNASTCS